jgi:hypothetical protein
MRIFQTIHKYDPYITHFEQKYVVKDLSFQEHLKLLISDRFYASHILQPCLSLTNGFYTMWDYESLQLKWARQAGWNETNLKKILFAQVEEYQPDVFYNMSPIRFTHEELKTHLSPNILKVAWFASPEQHQIDFSVYNTLLTNVPLANVARNHDQSFRIDNFQPAHDPIMDNFSRSENPEIDILFYGQYDAQFFKARNKLIESLLQWKRFSDLNIVVALQYNTSYDGILPFRPPEVLQKFLDRHSIYKVTPKKIVRKHSSPPLYGTELYSAISSAKITFNAAVDFSGVNKVNMRNFEVLGCGSHLISDAGIYPPGFVDGENYSSYTSFKDFKEKAVYFLENRQHSIKIAKAGNDMIRLSHSKDLQITKFKNIISTL